MAGIDEVLERLVGDPEFRRALGEDPKAALAGYELSRDDLEVLSAQLDEGTGGEHAVEQRTSKSAVVGFLAQMFSGGGEAIQGGDSGDMTDVVTEGPGGGTEEADYNGDGVVDGADFVVWSREDAPESVSDLAGSEEGPEEIEMKPVYVTSYQPGGSKSPATDEIADVGAGGEDAATAELPGDVADQESPPEPATTAEYLIMPVTPDVDGPEGLTSGPEDPEEMGLLLPAIQQVPDVRDPVPDVDGDLTDDIIVGAEEAGSPGGDPKPAGLLIGLADSSESAKSTSDVNEYAFTAALEEPSDSEDPTGITGGGSTGDDGSIPTETLSPNFDKIPPDVDPGDPAGFILVEDAQDSGDQVHGETYQSFRFGAQIITTPETASGGLDGDNALDIITSPGPGSVPGQSGEPSDLIGSGEDVAAAAGDRPTEEVAFYYNKVNTNDDPAAFSQVEDAPEEKAAVASLLNAAHPGVSYSDESPSLQVDQAPDAKDSATEVVYFEDGVETAPEKGSALEPESGTPTAVAGGSGEEKVEQSFNPKEYPLKKSSPVSGEDSAQISQVASGSSSLDSAADAPDDAPTDDPGDIAASETEVPGEVAQQQETDLDFMVARASKSAETSWDGQTISEVSFPKLDANDSDGVLDYAGGDTGMHEDAAAGEVGMEELHIEHEATTLPEVNDEVLIAFEASSDIDDSASYDGQPVARYHMENAWPDDPNPDDLAATEAQGVIAETSPDANSGDKYGAVKPQFHWDRESNSDAVATATDSSAIGDGQGGGIYNDGGSTSGSIYTGDLTVHEVATDPEVGAGDQDAPPFKGEVVGIEPEGASDDAPNSGALDKLVDGDDEAQLIQVEDSQDPAPEEGSK